VRAAVSNRGGWRSPEPTFGERVARSPAAKNFDGIASLLRYDVDFPALTPRRAWAPDDPPAVLEMWIGHVGVTAAAGSAVEGCALMRSDWRDSVAR